MMNEQQNKVLAQPLFQTIALCVVTLSAACFARFGGVLPGIFLMMVASGILTVIFFSTPRLYVGLEILAMLVIFLIAGGMKPILLLYPVLSTVASVLMYAMIRRRARKATVIIGVTVLLLVVLVIALLYWYLASGNEFTISAMGELIGAYFEKIRLMMEKTVLDTYASMDERMLSIYEQRGISLEELIEADIKSVALSVELSKMILPGILLLVLQIFGYIAATAYYLTAKASYGTRLIPAPYWGIFPTQMTCVIFMILAALYALCSFFVSSTSTFMVLVLNMILAIVPCMLVCGVGCLRLRMKHPATRRGTIIILVLAVIGLVFMPGVVLPSAFLLLGFIGAQDVFMFRATAAMQDAEQNADEDDDFTD